MNNGVKKMLNNKRDVNANNTRQSRSQSRGRSKSRANGNQKNKQRGNSRRRSNSRNRSKSRSNSRGRSGSKSRVRPYGTYKKVHVPQFGVNSHKHVFTISNQTFEIQINVKQGNPMQYTTTDYLIMALYFAVYARPDGRSLQNKVIKSPQNLPTVKDEIESSMYRILSNFPKDLQAPSKELYDRLHIMWDLFYAFSNSHIDGRKGDTTNPRSEDWHKGATSYKEGGKNTNDSAEEFKE
ncbi:hypothetical protein [Wuhan insect virus 19]|uniref:hypothetical protein n=1 Tax=Wuhan insect virus 19 TaxID=1923723 RepID=UPI00090BA4A2|nr:hypothetical protein [Wuhan insect virus 19]APG77334.1 hypothetical protein [Wuhan insect virus 19]